MTRARWIVAVAMVALLTTGGLAPTPAHAGVPFSSFNEIYDSFPMTVNGSYMPLVGALDCSAVGAGLGIVWYAPGSAADYRWYEFQGALPGQPRPHSSQPLSVNGTYEPFVGDFDGDGCDDIFWYAPGSAQDYVWYSDPDGAVSSHPVNVNGSFTPLVGDWDEGTDGDDIFWYAVGGGTESIWVGTATRGDFGVSTAPQVSGTGYRTTAIGSTLLFYRPGTGADYVWDDVVANASAPGESTKVIINGTYEPYGGIGVLLYGPGSAPDKLAYEVNPDGTLATIPGTINGTYRVGAPPATHGAGVLVFHAPGSATDYLWMAKFGSPPASAGFDT